MGKRDQVPRPPGGRPNVQKKTMGEKRRTARTKKHFFEKKTPQKEKIFKRKEKKIKEKKMNGGFYISPKPAALFHET